MIKVSSVVEQILMSSETSLSAFNQGILNYSAYAKKIKKEVELRSKKPVTEGSIVVSLSRLAKSNKFKTEKIIPKVKINDLAVKSPLVVITYDRTPANLNLMRELHKKTRSSTAQLLEITQGISEITIIASAELKKEIIRSFLNQKPKAALDNLVALTVKFDEKYINEPNVIFSLIRSLAIRRINIVELVSTYTELTFVIHSKDLYKAFEILNGIFQEV